MLVNLGICDHDGAIKLSFNMFDKPMRNDLREGIPAKLEGCSCVLYRVVERSEIRHREKVRRTRGKCGRVWR